MSALSDELANDPQGLGYQTHINAGDHQSVAAIINEPRYSVIGGRQITSTELLMWGAQAGRIARLEDAAADSQIGADVRSIASAALRMIHRTDTGLDLSDPQEVAMIDTLVQATVFIADDKSSLEALSTADISRADQLGLGRVTLDQIREAV